VQVVGTWKAKDGVKLVFPMVGGRGDDVAVTLNPQAGGAIILLFIP